MHRHRSYRSPPRCVQHLGADPGSPVSWCRLQTLALDSQQQEKLVSKEVPVACGSESGDPGGLGGDPSTVSSRSHKLSLLMPHRAPGWSPHVWQLYRHTVMAGLCGAIVLAWEHLGGHGPVTPGLCVPPIPQALSCSASVHHKLSSLLPWPFRHVPALEKVPLDWIP